MKLDNKLTEQIARLVVGEIKSGSAAACGGNGTYGNGYRTFDSMDNAIQASEAAQRRYLFSTMEDRQKYVDVIRQTVLEPEILREISRMVVEETGMGSYEYRLTKNRLVAKKSPGTEGLVTEVMTGDCGLALVRYCLFGVIGVVTPATNPIETIICDSIAMSTGGNIVMFSPHPRTRNVTHVLVTAPNQTLERVGAPTSLIVTMREPSVRGTNLVIKHPKIRVLVTVGGPKVVKTVMSTGKKAIGMGAGNPPIVVDETAGIEKAAENIVNGCSFDSSLSCIAEKGVITVGTVVDCLIWHVKRVGAFELREESAVGRLLQLVTNKRDDPRVELAGKNAPYILNKLSTSSGENTRMILMKMQKDHPPVMEELVMPILPIARAADVDEMVEVVLVVEHGGRHTAMMHSRNIDKLTKMAKLLQTAIPVKNAPSYAGINVGGEGCTIFTIVDPTGEGLTTIRSFCRGRRCIVFNALYIR